LIDMAEEITTNNVVTIYIYISCTMREKLSNIITQ